jgi:argonaute-like protein implicated in RNA metabolism and viral defense
MHIEVDQTEEQSFFEDEHIVSMLKNNASRKDVLKAHINVLEQRVKQYEDERAIINKIASKFASFLKHNSILPYNDGLEGYLKLAIQLAKRIAEQSGDRRRLDALEVILREYLLFNGIFL